MKGRRLPNGMLSATAFQPGDYQVVDRGSENARGLWLMTPAGDFLRLELKHVLDEDSTCVTVQKEIITEKWAGKLERGEWQERDKWWSEPCP